MKKITRILDVMSVVFSETGCNSKHTKEGTKGQIHGWFQNWAPYQNTYLLV